MSDSPTVYDALAYGIPPEQIRRAMGHVATTPNAALATAGTMIAPDPQLPNVAGYIPGTGLAESITGLADFAYKKLQQVAAPAPGSLAEKWGLRLPDAPAWMGQAGEHFEQNRDQVKAGLDKYSGGVLPQPDMSNTGGVVADLLGGAVGSGIGPLPAAAIARVPQGLKTVTSLMLAPREHIPRNAGLNLAITGAQTAADEAFHPGEALATTEQTATPPAASTVVAKALHPTAPMASPDNDPLGLFGQAKGGSNVKPPFDDVLGLGAPSPGPTYAQQGNVEPSGFGKALGLGSTGEALVDLGLIFATVAGGKALYRRGGAAHAAARDARLRDPDYAAQVNDYHSEVIKRGPGSGTLGGPDQVNAPLPQGNAVRKVVNYVADKTANDVSKNQDFINLTGDDPVASARLNAQLGNLHDTRLQHNQLLEFVKSGQDRQTRMAIPSMTKFADDVASLDSDRRSVWNEAMRARSEIEVRENNAADLGAKTPATPLNTHHDFVGKPTEELHVMADRLKSDPVFSELADRYSKIYIGSHEIGAHPIYKFFSPTELNDIKTKSKYAVPEFDASDRIKYPFGQRGKTPYTGQAHGGVDPTIALAAHLEQLYPLYQLEQVKQSVYAHYKGWMSRPGAAQFITELEKPTGPHQTYYPSGMTKFGGTARDPIVTLRENGVKHLRIDNPDVLHIMDGSSLGMSRVYLDAMDMGRRMYQKGTTGLLSTATTRAIPLRNSIFAAAQIPGNAPEGFRSGLLSKIHSNPVTRGLDSILNVTRLPVTAAQHVYDRFIGPRIANGVADLLHPQANNVFNQNLRAMMDPSLVDAMHQAARSRADNNVVQFMKERGLSGSSSPLHTEAPGIATGSEPSMVGINRPTGIRLETARVAPKAFMNERATWGKLTPAKAAIDGTWNQGRVIGIKIHNILGDAFNLAGDLGHEQFIRDNFRNPNIDRDRLAYEARNIVGNPSRGGSGKYMGYAASALPYTNVSTQGIGRTLRAIGEHPVGTPMTWAIGLGTMVLLEQLTHMRSAAHLDYLQNQVSLQQREANIELALNDDPNSPTVIPIAQEMRPALAFMKDFMSKVTNIIAARHDPDVFKAVWDGITHLLGSNITTSNKDAMIHAGVDIFDFINAPPLLGRMDWNSVFAQGKSLADAYHSVGSGSTADAPGGQGHDAPLDSANGQLFERLMASAFGAVAHTMQIPNSVVRYQRQGHSFLESMGMAGHDWLQTGKESNLMLNNMVWETQVRLSTNPPVAEGLQPALYALSKLKPDAPPGREGFVHSTPVAMTEDKPYSRDMLMQQMLVVARGFNSRIQQAKQPIDDIKTQMHSVEKVGMDPAKRRAWLNDRTREMADKWKLVEAYVSDLDNAMSNMAGKAVRIEDIDFSKDSSQFK